MICNPKDTERHKYLAVKYYQVTLYLLITVRTARWIVNYLCLGSFNIRSVPSFILNIIQHTQGKCKKKNYCADRSWKMLNYLSILRHKIAVKHSQIFYWIIENDKKKLLQVSFQDSLRSLQAMMVFPQQTPSRCKYVYGLFLIFGLFWEWGFGGKKLYFIILATTISHYTPRPTKFINGPNIMTIFF